VKTTAVLVAAAQCFAAADQVLRAGEGNEAIRARLEECLPIPGAMSFRRDWFVERIDTRP
jgi:hypothetical protein